MTTSDKCVVAFLDVGQGDSVVISLPRKGQAILVDCPKNRKDMVLHHLLDSNISEIALAVLTHTHRDHAGHFVELVENFQRHGGKVHGVACVPALIAGSSDTAENRQLLAGLSRLERNGVALDPSLFPILDMTMSGVSVKALHPTLGEASGSLSRLRPNEGSVALMISYLGNTLLLTGDLAGPGLGVVSARGGVDVDVLQVPHHGAWDDNLPAFLDKTNPKYAVISVGSSNDYNHPSADTLRLLNGAPTRIRCTEVTRHCHPEPSKIRDAVIPLLPDTHLKGWSNLGSLGACPCAGTVLVEMSSTGISVFPSDESHDPIVARMFSPQCRLVPRGMGML